MKTIDLDPQKAVFAVLNAAVQVDSVRIALGAYLEGAGLVGEYRLELTGARLVPVHADLKDGF